MIKKVHDAIWMHAGASMCFDAVLTGICVAATCLAQSQVSVAICVAVIAWLLFSLAVLMYGEAKEWPVRR